MKSILFVLTSHGELGDTGKPTGFWLAEAAHPWQVFTAAGCRVDLFSIRGGRPPIDGEDLSDPVQKAFRDLPELDDTRSIAEADPSSYDAVLYVGGHGAMWDFPGNESVTRLGNTVYQAGGVVAAVCHGPVGLLELTRPDGRSLLEGKHVTSFTDEEEVACGNYDVVPFLLQSALVERGARHTDAGVFKPSVVVDERLVTGQNPPSSVGVATETLRLLS